MAVKRFGGRRDQCHSDQCRRGRELHDAVVKQDVDGRARPRLHAAAGRC
jgi:hypothetical protein